MALPCVFTRQGSEKDCRSLIYIRQRGFPVSARLYTDQGINAQALLGHKTADMTAVYRDTRGAEWVEVEAL